MDISKDKFCEFYSKFYYKIIIEYAEFKNISQIESKQQIEKKYQKLYKKRSVESFKKIAYNYLENFLLEGLESPTFTEEWLFFKFFLALCRQKI